jgi:hypothetical protein
LPDPPDATNGSYASGVSGDGSVIAGACTSKANIQRACRWSRRNEGALSDARSALSGWHTELLGVLPGDAWSTLTLPGRSVSSDGVLVVGISGHDVKETAFVWDAHHKMRRVADVLEEAGITLHESWYLAEAWSASGDARRGYTIVGGGIDPDGQWEGWAAHIDARRF